MNKAIYISIILFLYSFCIFGQNEPLTVTGGNVGLNNTSPQESLDINGDLLVDGGLYSDTFAPVVKYFTLGDGPKSFEIPDATTNNYEVILIWKSGNDNDRILTITMEIPGQTIDGLNASTWKGEGTGKMRLLPYEGNWIVLSYIDQRDNYIDNNTSYTLVRHWIKLANGTLIQWGAKKLLTPVGEYYSPFHVEFLKEFTDNPVVTVTTHDDITFPSIGDENNNPTTTGFQMNIHMWISVLPPIYYSYIHATVPIYGYWRACGRWY